MEEVEEEGHKSDFSHFPKYFAKATISQQFKNNPQLISCGQMAAVVHAFVRLSARKVGDSQLCCHPVHTSIGCK